MDTLEVEEEEVKYSGSGSTLPQYIAVGTASLLGFCLGMEWGWSSPMLPLLTSSHPPVGTEPFTLDNVALLSSIAAVGAMIGNLFWGPLSDRLGRKRTALIVAFPHIISWIVILFAQGFMWILVGRLISGFAGIGSSITASIFVAEVAQDNMRGFFGCFYKVFYSAGLLYAYIMGTYLGYHGMALSCLVIPVLFLAMFVWLPETPLFYWKNGQLAEAERSLLWYRSGDVQATQKTLLSYKSLQNKKTHRSFKDLIATRGRTKALLVGISLSFALQMTGFSIIVHYAVRIFEMNGTSLSSHTSAIILAGVQLFFSILSSLLVDRWGRTFLFGFSLLSISISLMVLGSYLYFVQDLVQHSVLSFIPLICLCVHLASFSTGYGPVYYVYKTEIFHPDIRGLAMSVTGMVSLFLTFFFVTLFPTLERLWNLYGIFWFYGIICLFFALMFKLFLPETKGRAQSVIVKIFNNTELTPEDVEIEEISRKKKNKMKRRTIFSA